MTKPPLLFIYGLRGSQEGLAQIIANLESQGYPCFAPDIPPFGHSQSDLPEYTADTYADHIAVYIKQHNIKHPVLIGHSMGSIIAAATAAKYPELLDNKLVLLAPISTKPPRPIAALQPLVTIFPNKLIGFVTTQYLIIPRERTTLRSILDITYRCGEHYTSRAGVRAATRFSTAHAVSDFDFPQDTLLLAGTKDRLATQQTTVKLAHTMNSARKKSQNPNRASTKFIAKTGHLLNYEAPDSVARAIVEFLSSVTQQ